jgi:hypothetical protein
MAEGVDNGTVLLSCWVLDSSSFLSLEFSFCNSAILFSLLGVPVAVARFLVPDDRSAFVVFRKEQKNVVRISGGRGLPDGQLWIEGTLD